MLNINNTSKEVYVLIVGIKNTEEAVNIPQKKKRSKGIHSDLLGPG